MNRPDWVSYFLNIAETVSLRSSCKRVKVGCIIVRDKRILGTGYNGAPSGRKNCLERKYCYREENSIESGTMIDMCFSGGAHAEINAIVNCAKHGVSVDGSILFLFGHDFCCNSCQSAILNSGIRSVIIKNKKGDILTFNPLKDFSSHPILDKKV